MNPFKKFPVEYPKNFVPRWDDGKPEVRWDGKACSTSTHWELNRNAVVLMGSGFDDKRGTNTHDAVDLMALPGANIVAPDDCKIVPWRMLNGTQMPGVGNSEHGGNFIMLELSSGFRIYQCHLLELPKWKEGDSLKLGEVVGQVGRTGNAKQRGKGCSHNHLALYHPKDSGPLTWEGKALKRRNGKVDPVPYLKSIWKK